MCSSSDNKFYYLEESGDIYRSECFHLKYKDYRLFERLIEENKALKCLPFFKKYNLLKSMLNKRAKEHFDFFCEFFPKDFYSHVYDYFSSDTKNNIYNEEKLLIWQCFFDYKKENDLLINTFVFDEKRRHEKREAYDKTLRSTLLGKEFLEFSEDDYPGCFSYLGDTGNCDGLALYSFLDSLYDRKIFDENHIITLGSIKKNGDVDRVGESFNKLIYWLVYCTYRLKDEHNTLKSNELLFLISAQYSKT